MARRCFLPSSFFFSCFVTVQSVIIYGLKGQQTYFDPDITEQPQQILWKHNGNKVVEFNGTAEQVFGSYKGRVTLDWHSAQLRISDLRLEDSGEHEYEIYINRNLVYRSYELEVIDKVAKPNITCWMNSRSSSSVSAVLLCSVELNQTQSSLNFKWISKGNVQYGSQLTILLGGERDEEQYTCEVSNPASNETATFRAKDCKTDAGLSAGMIGVIVGISIVIICVGLVILFCRLKHKRTVDSNEKEFELKNIQIGRQTRDRQTDVDEETAEDEEERRFVEDQPTASSPQPQEQLDTENASEKEDRGAQSDAGGASSGLLSYFWNKVPNLWPW